MDLGTAVVTIVVAVLGISSGYFGAQWQARRGLAQWRRERLLEFCADLVAAGRQLVGMTWEKEERRYPIETVQRLEHAVACVLLLGGTDLDDPAFAYEHAVLDALIQALAPEGDANKLQEVQKSAVETQARFLWLAHNVLMGVPRNEHRWWQFWSRTGGTPKVEKV